MSVQSSWAYRRQIWGGGHEAILVDELEHILHHPHRCDLLEELDETCACVHRIASDRATEVGWLLRQVIRVVSVLFNLGLSPIGDIPQLLKITQDALLEVALVLERLQEALDSGDDCKKHMLTYIYICVCVCIYIFT
jgi:hypothetical protein